MTTPASTTKPKRRFSFLAKAALGLLLICLAGMSWLAVANYRERAALNALITRIQATGDPLTGAELNAYYALPDDADDLTSKYTAALRMFDDRKLSAEEKLLPFIGVQEEPPAAGKSWELEQAAEGYLESVRPQVDALRALATRRGAVRYPINLADGMKTLLPDAQRMREAGRRLRLDAYLRLRRGDRAGACLSLVALFRLSETLAEEPLLTSQLVRTMLVLMAVPTAEDILGSGIESEELDRLERMLQTLMSHEACGGVFAASVPSPTKRFSART